MNALKLKLLVDAVLIQMKRDKITAEEAILKYRLTKEEKEAILSAI